MKERQETQGKPMKRLLLAAMLLVSGVVWSQTSEVREFGTGTSSGPNPPFGNARAKAWTQSVYNASYFNLPTGGTITDIAFECKMVQSSFVAPTVTIYLGTTPKSVTDNNTDWVPMTSLTQVYSGMDAQPLSAGWSTIHLTTEFDYNGTESLVVVVVRNGTAASTSQRYAYTSVSGATGVFMMKNDVTVHPGSATSNTRNNQLANIRLTVRPHAGCYPPTGLVAGEATRTAVTLKWNKPSMSDPEGYMVEYGPKGFVRDSGERVVSTDTAVTLRGLVPSSRYEVYVSSICGAGDTSALAASAEFVTACGPSAFPYSEDFSTCRGYSSYNPANELPLCWEFPGLSATAAGYPRVYVNTGGTLRVVTRGGAPAQYVVLPAIDSSIENSLLLFDAIQSNNVDVRYGYITDPGDTHTFHALGRVPSILTYRYDLEEDFETIPYGARLAFRVTTTSATDQSFGLSSIRLEASPECKQPINVAVDSSHFTTSSMRLVWGGTQRLGETYRVRYVAYGATDTVTAAGLTAQNYTMTGLASGTSYSILVDKLCNGVYTEAATYFATTKGVVLAESESAERGYVTGEFEGNIGTWGTFRAVAMPHYHFKQWSDGRTQNPITLVYVNGDMATSLVAQFAPDTNTVTVAVNDGSRGSVNTTGGRYAYGTQIDLVATPEAGYTFAGWSDGTLRANYTYTVERDVTLTAYFCDEAQVRVFGVLNDPTLGSVTTVPSSGVALPGDTVTIIVSLNDTTHYNFHWEPAPAVTSATGMMRTAKVVAGTESQVVSGVISPKMFTVGVSNATPELGNVLGTGRYEYGSQVTVAARPASNVRFVQWRGDAFSNANPYTLTVDSDKNLIALFERDSITVQVEASYAERGNVSLRRPGGGATKRVAVGDTIGLVASANTHYSFHSWSNGNTAPTQILTAWGGNGTTRTYTAYFQPDMMEISAVANIRTWGNVDGSAVYGYGSNAYLEAFPHNHYFFIRWDDGSTDNPYRPLVTSNKTYTAIFGAEALTITAGVDNPLHGSASVSGEIYYSGTVTLTADTLDGWSFKAWLNAAGDTVSRSRIYTYQAFEDASYTAHFYRTNYHVLVTATAGMGEIVGGDVEGDYLFGDVITASTRVLDALRYEFVGWSHTGSTDPNLVYSVDSSLTITAVYRERDQYTLALSSNNTAWGTVSTDRTSYYPGETAIIRATPAPHYRFVKWSDGTADSALNLRIITMIESLTLTAIFAPERYGVSVVVNDRAKGYVTGGGMYEYNSDAVLTAIPFEGQYFEGWNGQPSSMPTLTVHVTGDTVVTASFATMNIDIEVSGIFATTTGTGTYPYGTPVLITATPNAHYEFSHWSDGSTFNPRTVIVDSTENYIAHCTPRRYTITGTPNEPSLGYVTGSDTRPYGSQSSRLEAFANPNSHFVRWSDGVTTASRVIRWDTNASYIAYFVKDSFDVTLVEADPAEGRVNTSINGRYEYDTRLLLVATPHAGLKFASWSDGDTYNPRVIVVRENVVGLTALFDSIDYQLDTLTNDNAKGHIVLTPAKPAYKYNEEVVVSYVNHDESRYRFVGWEDGSTDAARTLRMTEDRRVVAIFDEADKYTVAVVSNNSELGEALGSVSSVDNGTTHRIIARPAAHCHFVGWSDNCSTDTVRDVTLDGSDFVSMAIFARDSLVLVVNVSDSDRGYVSGVATGTALTLPYGEEVVLQAVSNPHCTFGGWSDGYTGASYSFTLTQDISLTAMFTVDSFTVDVVTADAAMGSVNGGEVSARRYAYGEIVTLEATPAAGYDFMEWMPGNGTANPMVVQVTGDQTYTATFAAVKLHLSAQANNPLMGVVAVDPEQVTYSYNQTVTLSARLVDSNRYRFIAWSDGETDTVRSVTMTSDVELMALFGEADKYSVTVVSGNRSMGSVVCSESSVYANSSVSIEAIAEAHCRFVGWSDGADEAQRTLTVTSDTLLVAYFEADTHSLVLEVEGQGVAGGAGRYAYGTQVTIYAVADAHSHFVGWADGNGENPRQVVMDGDRSFTARFALDTVEVVATAVHGRVTGGGRYVHGALVTLEVESDSLIYAFAGWTRNGLPYEGGPVISFAASENAIYVAHFELVVDTLCSVTLEGEHVTLFGAGRYSRGAEVTVCAVLDEGYVFEGWYSMYGRLLSTDLCYSFTAEGSIHLTALATVDPGRRFTVSTQTLPSAGGRVLVSINGVSGSEGHYGDTVKVLAQANEGYVFSGWGHSSMPWAHYVTDAAFTFVLTEDVTVVADFMSLVGIEESEEEDVRLYTRSQVLYVEGAQGRVLRVFDAVGRQVVSTEVATEAYEVALPSTGVYLVQVGGVPAKRVAVIR